jgi:hypothetical protein
VCCTSLQEGRSLDSNQSVAGGLGLPCNEPVRHWDAQALPGAGSPRRREERGEV